MTDANLPAKKKGARAKMTWSISWVVNLGAVAMVIIAIIVVAIAYLVYKK